MAVFLNLYLFCIILLFFLGPPRLLPCVLPRRRPRKRQRQPGSLHQPKERDGGAGVARMGEPAAEEAAAAIESGVLAFPPEPTRGDASLGGAAAAAQVAEAAVAGGGAGPRNISSQIC